MLHLAIRPSVAPRKGTRAGLSAEVFTAARTVGVLALLTAAFPVNLTVTGVALLRTLIAPPRRPTAAAHPRTVMISGGKMTKALQLARSFHAAGHRVVLVETQKYRLTGHRFSRAVDRFCIVPESGADDYAAALLRIVEDEAVDLYVPVCSPVASHYDALAKQALSGHCEVLHLDVDLLDLLDDKHAFSELAASVGCDVPESYRITAPDQVSI